MPDVTTTEAKLTDANHVLIELSEPTRLGLDFFGSVISPDDRGVDLSSKRVYLTGDISRARDLDPRAAARMAAIRELSTGYEHHDIPLVDLGKVPVRVAGAGVYYRRFFDDAPSYFDRISAEHTFQALTESSKPSKAHRSGIYLTPVAQHDDALHFHLLRCSTNLSGPTENFCATDHHIVDALNCEAALSFRDHAPLNHVLAQIYANTASSEGHKQTKAKISAHADKTKDMPVNGIMAFCTFYDGLGKLGPQPTDPFDYGFKGKSGLTKLRFRLKESAPDHAPGLVPEFTLTLYPGSVFFMPLSTNRLYTHEIQSSMLNAELLPTRLGYVVRCSKTVAVHRSGTTFLNVDGGLVAMEPPTEDGMTALRQLYAAENKTDAFIDYGDRFRFSMNAGDYLAPDLKRG